MIRNLKNSIFGQIFLGSIVLAIILAFVLTGAAGGSALRSSECAVQVGKSCVSPKEFFAAYGLLSAVGPGGINEAAAAEYRLKEQVARGLAEREVLLSEAQRLGIGTGKKELDDALVHGLTRVSIPAEGQTRLAASLGMCIPGPAGCEPGTVGLRGIAVNRDGEFDFDVYKRSVRIWTKRSLSHFKEMQAREFTAEKLRQLVRGRVRVSPEEAFLAYSRIRSQATARTVELNTDWFLRFAPPPTEEAVKKWASENKEALAEAKKSTEEAWMPGCAVVSEILIKNADPAAEKASAAKEKAEKLRLAARSGNDFYQLAREQSEAPSAPFGGRIGCLSDSYGPGAATLEEAAKALTRPGDISSVLETIQGFVVLRLEGTVSEENQADLLNDYLSYRGAAEAAAQTQAQAFAEQLIKNAAQATSLEAATEALLLKTLDLESADEKHPALEASGHPQVEISRAITIEQNPLENASDEVHPGIALFELEKEDDVYPSPIPLKGGFAVMQLKSKEMLSREKFEEDKAQVIQTLTTRKAEQELARYVSELVKKAGGITLNESFIPPQEDKSKKEKDS